MWSSRSIISLIVHVVDRCCNVCTTQLTQMLVCARNVSLCFVTSSFVRSELRQGRHNLADVRSPWYTGHCTEHENVVIVVVVVSPSFPPIARHLRTPVCLCQLEGLAANAVRRP